MQAFYRVITFLVFTMLSFLPYSRAEDTASVRNIQGEEWRQLTADKAFSYKNEIEHFTPPRKIDNGVLQKMLQALGNMLGSSVWTILLWIIVLVLVIYVVYTVIISNGNFLFSKKNKKIPIESEVEISEKFEETNWELLLQNALKDNNLRMATRYSYMWLLKLMQEKGLIQYREDKTNFEYYRELEETTYKQSFKKLSRDYEFAFYGNYTPTEAAYNEYANLFNDVKKQLGR